MSIRYPSGRNSHWAFSASVMVFQTHNLAALLSYAMTTRTETLCPAELSTSPSVCRRQHEDPQLPPWSRVMRACVISGVLLHLVHLWAAHLADCCLFCLLIDGRGPGHLRSTAVDSSEIESSSRSVTMSSLRSWLGRPTSKTSPLGGWGGYFMNFNRGRKCDCTWKWCRGGWGDETGAPL